jgi:hypothetical protein
MKRILLSTLVILSLYFSANAQLEKGSWMVGGSLGVSSTTTPEYQGNYTTTQVSISPRAGYFFIDRLTAGLSINSSFSHSHYGGSSANPNTYNDNAYGVGPFVRYYFLPTQKPANILLELSDQYSWLSYSGLPNTERENSYGFAAGPAFFLSPSVALECTLGYTWNKTINYNPQQNSHVFRTAIGLQVYLGGKHHKA